MKNLKSMFLWMAVFSCFAGESDTPFRNDRPPLAPQIALPDEEWASADQESVERAFIVFEWADRAGQLTADGWDTFTKWFFPKDPTESVLYDILPEGCFKEISLEYEERKPWHSNRDLWWPFPAIKREILSLPACRRWILQEEEERDESVLFDPL